MADTTAEMPIPSPSSTSMATSTRSTLQKFKLRQWTLPPTQSTENSYSPSASPVAFAERGYADTDVDPTAGWSRPAVIPAGTEIVVRTIDPIHMRRPDPRQHFLASVEQDVVDADGRVVIPRGSPAHLIVHEVASGDIALDLRSVSVNGRRLISIARTSPTHGPAKDSEQTSAPESL